MKPPLLAVIPARYASTRFPGKPLALIDGKPMIQWVDEAARSSGLFDLVKVATDDQRIADVVTSFGGEVEMTGSHHATGTDRVAEVASRYPQAQVVVNLQGDQPMVTADVLRRLIAPFANDQAGVVRMATVACPLAPNRHADPHTVKVICDQAMDAIYFSRATIPFFNESFDAPVYHHLGLYAFRASFLQTFCRLPPTPLERCEGLEQLRAIEAGYRIRVSLISRVLHEVNVPEDLNWNFHPGPTLPGADDSTGPIRPMPTTSGSTL